MAKNNKLINSLNEIARRNRSQNVATAADQMVPQIYAAIAIALHRTEVWINVSYADISLKMKNTRILH